MGNDDNVPHLILIVVNLVFLIGFGWPLAGKLSRSLGSAGTLKWMFALAGIYLAECVAFSASMATNVWSFALAFVWGAVFGRKFRNIGEQKPLLLKLSLFTCLPAISFVSILILAMIGGWPIFTVEGGISFGIPEFVPWPFSTMLGFFAAVIGSAIIVKTFITTKIAAKILRRAEKKIHGK